MPHRGYSSFSSHLSQRFVRAKFSGAGENFAHLSNHGGKAKEIIPNPM